MSTATVHRRKASATTGAIPCGQPPQAKPKPRSRSPLPSLRCRRLPGRRSRSAAKHRSSDTGTVRAASLHPRAAAASNFVPDPVTLELTDRAEHPMLTPSWHAFRAYASNHPQLSELKAQGSRSHDAGPPRAASGDLRRWPRPWCCSLWRFWPIGGCCRRRRRPTRPYATADAGAAQSTAVDRWEQGVVPSLYQKRHLLGRCALRPGHARLHRRGAGVPGHGLCGGDRRHRPTLPSSSRNGPPTMISRPPASTPSALVPAASGLRLRARRRAHGRRRRGRCATPSSRTCPCSSSHSPAPSRPTASVVVLDDIDKDSRIVLHDPTSASRSAKGWAFGDITGAAALAFTVHEA